MFAYWLLNCLFRSGFWFSKWRRLCIKYAVEFHLWYTSWIIFDILGITSGKFKPAKCKNNVPFWFLSPDDRIWSPKVYVAQELNHAWVWKKKVNDNINWKLLLGRVFKIIFKLNNVVHHLIMQLLIMKITVSTAEHCVLIKMQNFRYHLIIRRFSWNSNA